MINFKKDEAEISKTPWNKNYFYKDFLNASDSINELGIYLK